jgi:putative transcriptional regulator
MSDGAEAGRLIVATPSLRDPNFARTVVLLLESNEEGALGLVLNRPSRTSVAEVLPQWWPIASEPAVVFGGGPVSPSSAICLAAGGAEPGTGYAPLRAGLGTVDLDRDPDEVSVQALRVFAGYAGWGAGQLQGEIAEGAWYVLDARPDDAFSDDPAELWSRVLRREGGSLALVATCPIDPTMN